MKSINNKKQTLEKRMIIYAKIFMQLLQQQSFKDFGDQCPNHALQEGCLFPAKNCLAS